MPDVEPGLATNAIDFPSGDHDGCPNSGAPCVSAATPDPSEFIVYISPIEARPRKRTKAIRLVADHAGSKSAYLSRPDLARSDVRPRRPVPLALTTLMPPAA